jgi:hypothetical protein
MFKSRRTKWVGHLGEIFFFVGKPEGKRLQDGPGKDEKAILKWVLWK